MTGSMESRPQTEVRYVPACWCCTSWGAMFWGVVLILVGGAWLLDEMGVADIESGTFWAVVLIGIGAFSLFMGLRDSGRLLRG